MVIIRFYFYRRKEKEKNIMEIEVNYEFYDEENSYEVGLLLVFNL